METIWFCLVAVMIAVYVVLDGFDLGAGIVHLLVARTDDERRQVLRVHRSGVGRQRSVAAGRRRHAVLRLSGALRIQLQRLLSAADDGAVAADSARHFDRIPQSHRQPGVEAVLGRWSSAVRARCWRSSSARRWATWCAACRSMRPANSSCRCGPISASAARWAFWTGTPCWSAWPRFATLTGARRAVGGAEDRGRAGAARAPGGADRLVGFAAAHRRASPGAVSRSSRGSERKLRRAALGLRVSAAGGGRADRHARARPPAGAAPFLCSSLFIVGMLTSAAFGLYPYVLPSNTDPRAGADGLQRRGRAVRIEGRPGVVHSGHAAGHGLLRVYLSELRGQGGAGGRGVLTDRTATEGDGLFHLR